MSALRVGAASINISPPLGLRKGGFRLFGEPISSIDAELELGVAVLQSKGVTIAVIGCDLSSATTEEANEFRDTVADILKIERASVLFNVSHNHSAPALKRNYGSPSNEEEFEDISRYQNGVIDKLAQCTRSALANMKDARMAHAWGAADLNIYRREWNNGQDILGEVIGHPVDDSVGVIRFDDLNGKAILTFFRYSCHPVVNGAVSTTLSADFPGPARKLVEEKVGGIGIFLQGCGGNLNPKIGIGYEKDCSESVYRVGTALGAEVVRIALGLNTHRFQSDRTTINNVPNVLFKPWNNRTDHPEVTLAGAEEIVKFRYSPLPDESYLRSQEEYWRKEITDRIARGALSWEIRSAKTTYAWVQMTISRLSDPNPTDDFTAHALRIGDVALVGLGVEAFFETGEEIQAKSPMPETFVLGYTNGSIMYLPRKEDYPPGGWKSPNKHALPDLLPQVYCQPALWHPDSEQEAVAAALRVLGRVASA
jgi:hypothetical protein